MPIQRFYLVEESPRNNSILKDLQKINKSVVALKTEKCFHVELDVGQLSDAELRTLKWILKNPQQPDTLTEVASFANSSSNNESVIEVGPRFNFSTPDSTNNVSICQNVGLKAVKRIETSIKYVITYNFEPMKIPSNLKEEILLAALSDQMTQCRYTDENIPKISFDERLSKKEEKWYFVPILEQGRKALEEVNIKLGLAFDNWDLDFYTNLFVNVLKRDPTSVELFDCAQSNSEHSRHWFFRGKMIVDGEEKEKSLIKMIIDTQKHSNDNNTIKFSDNSSAIKGFSQKTLRPTSVTGPSHMTQKVVNLDLIFTAETHNMPTAVAPFSGATTGTGGRIRDVQGVGRGGITIAGTAGYCVGNLNIPDYKLSYENSEWEHPSSFASPLKIIIEASNGASDYGNKFGEPLISGFAISYGIESSEGQRDEFVKPIMFSGGLGTMDSNQTKKFDPKVGMLLAKIGGPVYRIGVGGGAASSVEVQGDNKSELDFNAVQRGDAEMENKLNRVVRACVEMGDRNPILAIHDQGAGGNGNVLKELVEPGYAGAVIFTKEFQLGDPTINALELWGAEYQENNAILCKPEDRELMEKICARERCPINFVGAVNGNGFVTLIEGQMDLENYMDRSKRDTWGDLPFDMHLENVLGDMPTKDFHLNHIPISLKPLVLPDVKVNYNEYLEKVFSVLAVGSKRFLTSKVDRCVTGLIAQQQCVGPLHTPLADYAVTAVSHFGFEGIATSIGTQPIKGLLSAKAGARMSVAEAISNLVFVGISELADVKCSGNWMWAAKLPGEGAKLFDACQEMCTMMSKLNIAVDGGKDSLSMAARVEGKTIKSPGTLVISTYAPCPNISVKITPDFKSPATNKVGELVWVNIEGQLRLGGSTLAQVFGQQGETCPDLDKIENLKNAFNITQKLLKSEYLLSGHDISDGGLAVCLLEMAIGGISGLYVDLEEALNQFLDEHGNKIEFKNAAAALFAEECGWVLETSTENLQTVLNEFKSKSVPAYYIGKSIGFGLQSKIDIKLKNRSLISTTTLEALRHWEKTSHEIEKLQMNRECALEEYASYGYRTGPKYQLSFDPDSSSKILQSSPTKVAVIREEGVNGDREMIASLMKANFEVHDVTMTDLLDRKTNLDKYRGVVFPGGFSYADTSGSAKGWAASILFNELLAPQFQHFKERKDTFSLGCCNGCQLMSLIGWVGDTTYASEETIQVPNVALLHNKSERYECRWSTVRIEKTNAIMLRRMTDTVIGCWIAHGEGKFSFKNPDILQDLKDGNCIAVRYVDDSSKPTETYPMNPNGSPEGIAGICSLDGRHLAMMPHPERCSEMFQWPFVPPGMHCKKSPWQSMFDEAYEWCIENPLGVQ